MMSTPRDHRFDRVRAQIVEALSDAEASGVRRFGAWVGARGSWGARPCWGRLASRLEDGPFALAERLELADRLVAVGDARSLAVFVYANRARPVVLRRLCAQARSLPRWIQRALVCAPGSPATTREPWCGAARELLTGDAPTRAREWELFRGRVGALRSFDGHVGDVA